MRTLTFLALLLPFNLFAQTVHCPTPELVLMQRLVNPIQNSLDETQWNFRSGKFHFDNKRWYVEFGSFFQSNLSPQQALDEGRKFYSKINLKIPNPTPYDIGNTYLCIYMPEGENYWVSAAARK